VFNELKNLFQPEYSLKAIALIATTIHELINLFDEELLKDESCKNAAIDALISILQSEKSK
jgi:hypothetical protein